VSPQPLLLPWAAAQHLALKVQLLLLLLLLHFCPAGLTSLWLHPLLMQPLQTWAERTRPDGALHTSLACCAWLHCCALHRQPAALRQKLVLSRLLLLSAQG
jgi:hypothetical protein